jgi:hypothetical protein
MKETNDQVEFLNSVMEEAMEANFDQLLIVSRSEASHL